MKFYYKISFIHNRLSKDPEILVSNLRIFIATMEPLGQELLDQESIAFFRPCDITDTNEIVRSIHISYLEKYPESFLSMLVSKNYKPNKEAIPVCIPNRTLELILHFYKNDMWLNPYIKGNQLEIPCIIVEEGLDLFEANCRFLLLPSYPFREVDSIDYDTSLSETSYLNPYDEEFYDDMYNTEYQKEERLIYLENKKLDKMNDDHYDHCDYYDYYDRDL